MQNYFKYISLLILFTFIVYVPGHAFTPGLFSYDKEDYNAGRQNWDIDIDEHGIVYFGNSDGLLYNVYGEWHLATMAQKGVVRAVNAEKDTIWCGGLEFGYFKKISGDLVFTKLGAIKGRQIWNIEIANETVAFQSEDKIVLYDKRTQSTDILDFESGIWSIINWNGNIWMVLRDGRIGYFQNKRFKSVTNLDLLTSSEVRKLIVHKDQLYIIFFEGGIISFDGKTLNQVNLPESLRGSTFFSGTSYDEESYCLGTINEGFLRVSNTDILNTINSNHGLIDNTVLSMKTDAYGNLWLGLDYGIAKVELQSAINTIFDGAATYSIKDYKGSTYLATNKGLFRSKGKNNFEIVPNTSGQVWDVNEIDEELYICHNRGLLKLKNDLAETVQDYAGFVDIARFEGTDYFIFSNYHGLFLTKKEGENFITLEELGIWGHPNLTYDDINKCIWADIRDQNIYKLSLNNDFKIEKEEISEVTKVFNTSDGVYFSNQEYLLQYSDERFVNVDNNLLNTVKGSDIRSLDISPERNIVAYIQGEEVKLDVLLPDGNIHSYSSLLKSLGKSINVGGEYIDIKNNIMRLATDRGVAVFNIYHASEFKKHSHPVITSLSILDEDQQNYIFPFPAEGIHFQAGNKDLMFRYGIDKLKYDVVEYRYRLSPHEADWSDWKSDNDKSIYTNIKGGAYTFQLQSRVNGGVPVETSLPITIEKLWYQTPWILLPIVSIAFLWIIGVIIIMARINRRKLKTQEQQFKKLNTEKTLNLKNEQLLQYTEIISHKNQFLNRVKTGLESMRNSEAQRWVKMIDDEVNNEKKDFLFHKLFSELHQDFINRISESFPDLTSNDIRILSFIRINLDNKEISNLMNITSRSLDTNRYRIRKKLGVLAGDDLNQFIREF